MAKKQTGKFAKSGNKGRAGVIIAICVALIIIIVGIVAAYSFFSVPNVVNTNITIAGVNVYGMTRDEAIEAVRQATANTYSKNDMVITIENQTITIPAAQAGASLDVEKAVVGALKFKPTTQQDAYALDLSPYLTLDTAAVRSAVDEIGQHFNTVNAANSYEVTGTKPADPSKVAAGEGQTLVLTIGTPEYGLDLGLLYDAVMAAYHNNTFTVDYELSYNEPTPVDLDAVYAEYCTEVVDATMDPETFDVIDHVYGYGFDLEAAKAAQAEAEYGSVLNIAFQPIAPSITAEELSEKLFRDVLSKGETHGNGAAGRVVNLKKACEKINGVVIYPGETFDYNTTLGERTKENGWKEGATYFGGEVIQTYGGGICQVSSTLYYCALLADLEIVARDCHGYTTGYLDLGYDATVSWGGPEFRFRNNQDYPIRIEAWSNGGSVYVNLIGTDEKDYYVKMSNKVLAVYSYDVKEVEIDPKNNPKGYTDGQVITSPYTGYKVETYRNYYSKTTDELIETKYEALSIYNKRDKEVAKLKVEETTPPTEATTPSEPSDTTEPPITTDPPSSEETTPPVESTPGGDEEIPGSGGNITE